MNKLYSICLILFIATHFGACDKASQAEKDEAIIQEYIEDNELTSQVTASGIHYIIEREGAGGHPNIGSIVTVDYRGILLDGTVFDSSYERGQAAVFGLWEVISGWQEGIPLFQKGGSGTLIIPSELAYGRAGVPGVIPSNAVLIFEIELHDFE